MIGTTFISRRRFSNVQLTECGFDASVMTLLLGASYEIRLC